MVMQVKYESDTESHGLGPGPCSICGSIKWIPSCGSSPNKAAKQFVENGPSLNFVNVLN